MVRQRYIKLGGFIDDSMDYLTLNELQEARRLVPLLGGRERVLALADTSVEGDPRWAARLANYLLLVEANDSEALLIRQKAFLKVAQTTNSANERNYLLGLILEEKGEIDFKARLAPMNLRAYDALTNASLLQRLKYRFRAEAADHVDLSFRVQVEGDVFLLTVRNNVLRVQQESYAESADIKLSHADLVAITAHTKVLGDVPGWSSTPMATLASLIE
jgi:alkyl sulfatase BDS1-like metallo-beta-lactamase superfamily hydrolase